VPNFYFHVLATHGRDYLNFLKKVSKEVGFQVTTKLLAQDAVEGGHKLVVLSLPLPLPLPLPPPSSPKKLNLTNPG